VDPFAPTTPIPGACCDKRDREVSNWKGDNNNLKFKHMFKLRNSIFSSGKLDAEVRTFHRVNVLGSGHIWFAVNANACIDIVGSYHRPCSDIENPCSSAARVITTNECNCWYHHNLEWSGNGCFIYLNKDQIESNATCWGASSKIKLSDCD